MKKKLECFLFVFLLLKGITSCNDDDGFKLTGENGKLSYVKQSKDGFPISVSNEILDNKPMNILY